LLEEVECKLALAIFQ